MNEPIHYTSKLKEHRDLIKVKPTSRTRCSCGCKGISTHIGTGQGAGMTSGCELFVRRWVRDGSLIFKTKR